MTKPKLQPERGTPSENSCAAAGETAEIVEIRNVTLKEALRMVRALADRAPSEENYPQPEI
jgi:hypothetical protein